MDVADAAVRDVAAPAPDARTTPDAAASPDATTVAGPGLLPTVRCAYFGPGRPAHAAWSPDGQTLASGNAQGFVKLFRSSDGEEAGTFAAHTGALTFVAFGPDGSTLASAAADGTVRLWTPDRRTPTRTITLPAGTIARALAFQADGRAIAAGSDDGVVRLWSVADGSLVRMFAGATKGVTAVATSADGRLIAGGAQDGTARIWTIADGQMVQTLTHGKLVTDLAFDPTSAVLASAGDDPAIKLWSVTDGTLVKTLPGHSHPVSSIRFIAGGQRLVSAEEKLVKVWRIQDGIELSTTAIGGAGRVAISADGATVASLAPLAGWEVGSGKSLFSVQPIGQGSVVGPRLNDETFSADGSRFVARGPGFARVYDVDSGKLLRAVSGVSVVALSSDGKTVAVLPGTAAVQLVDVDSGTMAAPWKTDAAGIGARFSADDKHLVLMANGFESLGVPDGAREYGSGSNGMADFSVSADGTRLGALGPWDDRGYRDVSAVWDLTKSARLWLLPNPVDFQGARYETGVAFSPSGTVASATSGVTVQNGDGSLALWIGKSSSGPVALDLSADESTVLVSFFRGQINNSWFQVWRPGLNTVAAHRGYTGTLNRDGTLILLNDGVYSTSRSMPLVTALSGSTILSGDGNRAASRPSAGTYKVTDVATGSTIRMFSVAASSCRGNYALSSDGAHLVTADCDVVRVWNVEDGSARPLARSAPSADIAVAISSDASKAAALGMMGIEVWRVSDGTKLATLPFKSALSDYHYWLRFSPDDSMLIAADGVGMAQSWRTSDWTVIDTVSGVAGIHPYAMSSAGLVYDVDQRSGKVEIWNARTRTLVQRLSSHRAAITSVAFAADGGAVASASSDWLQIVRLSDAKILDSTPFTALGGSTDSYTARLTLSPTAQRLADSGGGGVAIWCRP
jgi:WD40 repeat protein